jgi:hypothetical protein
MLSHSVPARLTCGASARRTGSHLVTCVIGEAHDAASVVRLHGRSECASGTTDIVATGAFRGHGGGDPLCFHPVRWMQAVEA